MRVTLVGSATGLVLGALVFACPNSLQAGWGILSGGSSGGGSSGYSAYGSSGGSSGGYTAAYGSSGGAAYGSSGYTASYGSSGYAAYSSIGGGSSGGSSGGPGLLRRVADRVHDHLAAKRARRAAYASSGGSSGYGSSGGYHGSRGHGSSGHGSSGGYSSYYSGGSSGGSSGGGVSYGSVGGVSYGSVGGGVSYGSTGGVSYGSTHSMSYGASTQSDDVAASLVSNAESHSDAVYLTVAVPAEAKVFVNGNATSSTGAVRKFVSRGLKQGKEYKFQIRAELLAADGQTVIEEKTLVVSAGQQEQVQFAFSDSQSPVETAITLNLPEGAKVLLAGTETKATGTTRTFHTSRLKPGQFWDDYEIEVQLGDQVKRQTVRLIGGDQLQLTFDFTADSDRLAAR
ncbi:MAG: TIGR03000 domain-containing protein [Planctomycetales bacterium]|nr:TIGR03000 domain-containing protein [Planctomycetales bacterium]